MAGSHINITPIHWHKGCIARVFAVVAVCSERTVDDFTVRRVVGKITFNTQSFGDEIEFVPKYEITFEICAFIHQIAVTTEFSQDIESVHSIAEKHSMWIIEHIFLIFRVIIIFHYNRQIRRLR